MSNSPKYDLHSKTLRVSSDTLNELNSLMGSKQKIKAIKILRSETKCGLREAKEALERCFESSASPTAFDIRPLTTIKSITINMGEGDVTLSMDDLQMMTLVNMTSIGIEETRRILDLHDMLSAWEGIKKDE